MKKILVIEDERYLLEMYRIRFEKAGYQVLTAPNGKPGFEIAQKEKPDLILLDVLMPKMDGYELIKKLKQDPSTRKSLILVFSNLDQPTEIKKGLTFGADDYVIKADLTPKEVLGKIEKMLNQAKKQNALPKKRILIITANEKTIQFYARRLTEDGFEVTLADNEISSLKLTANNDFDIILLDMTISDINGYKILKRFQDNPPAKSAPILVLSDSTKETEVAKALEMGAKDYFIQSKTMPEQIIDEIKKDAKIKDIGHSESH